MSDDGGNYAADGEQPHLDLEELGKMVADVKRIMGDGDPVVGFYVGPEAWERLKTIADELCRYPNESDSVLPEGVIMVYDIQIRVFQHLGPLSCVPVYRGPRGDYTGIPFDIDELDPLAEAVERVKR